MNSEILDFAADFRTMTAYLKSKSWYYPEVFQVLAEPKHKRHIHDMYLYASTLVRVERNGIWYIIHCVERAPMSPEPDTVGNIKRIMESAHKIQNLWVLNGGEEVDRLQQSEVDRLLEREPGLYGNPVATKQILLGQTQPNGEVKS